LSLSPIPKALSTIRTHEVKAVRAALAHDTATIRQELAAEESREREADRAPTGIRSSSSWRSCGTVADTLRASALSNPFSEGRGRDNGEPGGRLDSLKHLVAGVLEGGADAVLAASIFHFGEHTVSEAKAAMAAAGIEVR